MVTVEIIAIGNELLIGDVLDTNSHWLIKQVTGLGAHVRRATLIRDDPDAIGDELRGALTQGTDVIFTTGGLGPTADDLTLAAIGQALGRPMALDETALAMVERRYRELSADGFVAPAGITAWRRKMAVLPEGAIPVFNPVGGAPAAVLHVERSTIIALPGVPDELKGIFRSTLQPTLKELFGQATYLERAFWVDVQDESIIAGELARVASAHPEVYIKSRAGHFGPGMRIQVTFSAAGPDHARVEAAVSQAMADLATALRAAGIAVEPAQA
jgi:molybdenum cofactor synthesis domain-containing protein